MVSNFVNIIKAGQNTIATIAIVGSKESNVINENRSIVNSDIIPGNTLTITLVIVSTSLVRRVNKFTL